MALTGRDNENIRLQQTEEMIPPQRRQKSVGNKTKRPKYTTRACVECQRRKVKCSGEDICYHCRVRGEECVYLAKLQESRRKPKHRAFTDSRVHLNLHGRPSRQVSSQDSNAPSVIEVHSPTNRISPRLETLETNPNRRKDDSLTERVRMLEKMMQLVASSSPKNATERSQQGATDEKMHPDRVHLPPDLHEEYQDLFSPSHPDDLSVASQLAELRNALGMSPMTVPFLPNDLPREFAVTLVFPAPPKLQHLLNVYFYDFHCYFPFIDREDTERRILKTLEDLKYGDENHKVLVGVDDLSVMCLLCNMVAMGECLDSTNGVCDDSKPGWFMYYQGQKAAQIFMCSKNIDLDVVRYRVISVSYLLHSELLRLASHAVSVAYQSATAIKLHKQAAWSDCSPEEIDSRRRLWWTLYFLDRRIAQKSGLAYQIRDGDFTVEEFSNKFEIRQASQQDMIHGTEDPNGGVGSTGTSSSADEQYIQALINIGKLWGYIWDKFFAAASVQYLEDSLEIELMDTRILNVKRRLPQNLVCDIDHTADHIKEGQSEPQIRRQLQIYTRLNLFRMLIRQSPLHPNPPGLDTVLFCGELACETIATHAKFCNFYPEARSSGYFATVSMVECVYHLAPLIRHSSLLEEHPVAISSLQSAIQVVAQLAPKLNVAKRALRALRWISSQCGGLEIDHIQDLRSPEQVHHESQESANRLTRVNNGQAANEPIPMVSNSKNLYQNTTRIPSSSLSPRTLLSSAVFDFDSTPVLGETYLDLNTNLGLSWENGGSWDFQDWLREPR